MTSIFVIAYESCVELLLKQQGLERFSAMGISESVLVGNLRMLVRNRKPAT